MATTIVLVARWPFSTPVHVPSPAETKAIQSALAVHTSRNGRTPHPKQVVKTTKLEGMGWIVQVIQDDRVESEGYRVIHTYHVVGPGAPAQWLSTVH